MKRIIKCMVSCILIMTVWLEALVPVTAKEEKESSALQLSAPSVLLMEVSTGKVIYEQDADAKRPPASVTKIMTLLLIFDAIADGKIKLEDSVTVSEYAASMGGSQVFLEPGEVQSVETMIKCISIASANDACVAMAELISGSEETFVEQMNKRAAGLGMKQTHFVNCNGLDMEGHETTAGDIALMSREMLRKYPQIHKYCTVWMENITHTTKKGTTQFGLTNTNKLIRHYPYATGLKTGSTGKAKFCISATAKKDDIELIAVVMAADNSKLRNKDAIALLNYGFGQCQKYSDDGKENQGTLLIKNGKQERVHYVQKTPYSYIDTAGVDLKKIEKDVQLKKSLNAPIKQGDKLGEVIYRLNGEMIGTIDLIAAENIEKETYIGKIKKILKKFFNIS